MQGLEPRSILLATGMLYIAMPVAVLLILFRRHPRQRVLVWCASGACLGVTSILYAVRGVAPDWLSIAVANLVGYAAFFFKLPVLQLEQDLPPRWGRSLALWTAGAVPFVWAFVTAQPAELRTAINGTVMVVGAVLVACRAEQLARRVGSRSARLIAVAYAAYAALVSLRVLRLLLGLTDGLPISPQLDFMLLLVAAMLAALFGNVGYLGLALERSRDREREQRLALDTLREQQQALEASRRAREAVRSERYRSSQVLAHEVRQPLHNAAVALQSALARLDGGGDTAAATRAVRQAQAVLQRVSASLDNTVAAASLLTGEGRVTRQDVELAMLVDLCVADLPAEARARVRVDNRAESRSAYLEPGLVRLALRNLLINATRYAEGDSPVTLRLQDSDDPLALQVVVADLGPGLPEARAEALNQDREAPPSMVPGQGLGLLIVRRVAELHGGTLRWQPNDPHGSVFTLTLPQTAPD